MKRVLLLGIVLAILILAMPQGVLASDIPGDVVVSADYAGSELIFVPNTISSFSWELFEADADDNLYPGALEFDVDSTLDWDVFVKDAKTSDTGKMVSGSYHCTPFEIEDTDGLTALTGSDQLIEKGAPVDEYFTKDIAQPVGQSDYSATGYQVTLTFTCSNGWSAPV